MIVRPGAAGQRVIALRCRLRFRDVNEVDAEGLFMIRAGLVGDANADVMGRGCLEVER